MFYLVRNGKDKVIPFMNKAVHQIMNLLEIFKRQHTW